MVIIPTRTSEILGLCIEYIFVDRGDRFILSFVKIQSELCHVLYKGIMDRTIEHMIF